MSAFLGPIHYWLYNKILFQNSLTNNILSEYDKGGLRRDLAVKYGELERGPLEDIIDGANIHGWLQQCVSLVEGRLAEVVTALCSRDKAVIFDLEKLAYEFGRANRPAPLANAKEWYNCLNDTLLDGMPCDRVNELINDTGNEVVWQRTQCIHKSCWDAVNGNVENYYRLRSKIIAGMIDGSGFTYEMVNDDTFRLRGGV